MKQWKILEILGSKEWKGEHGSVFYIQLKLDNGETITLGKKKADAFKVGDLVSYEVVEEGKKWKEVKENPFQKKPFNPEATNRGAMVGMAYKLAFELVYKKDTDFQTAVALANRIYEEAMATYNAGSGLDQPLEKKVNDDLPF